MLDFRIPRFKNVIICVVGRLFSLGHLNLMSRRSVGMPVFRVYHIAVFIGECDFCQRRLGRRDQTYFARSAYNRVARARVCFALFLRLRGVSEVFLVDIPPVNFVVINVIRLAEIIGVHFLGRWQLQRRVIQIHIRSRSFRNVVAQNGVGYGQLPVVCILLCGKTTAHSRFVSPNDRIIADMNACRRFQPRHKQTAAHSVCWMVFFIVIYNIFIFAGDWSHIVEDLGIVNIQSRICRLADGRRRRANRIDRTIVGGGRKYAGAGLGAVVFHRTALLNFNHAL